MKFELNIARRYLFAKKSHHAINIISGISAFGVAIATMALVCILSVFNGFHDKVAELFTSFDPQLKVEPVEGKYMDCQAPELQALRQSTDVAVLTEVVEDHALLSANSQQIMVTVKGVDDTYTQQIDFDRIRKGDGDFTLESMGLLDYGVMGYQLMRQLGLDTEDTRPVQVFAPKKGEKINPNSPEESFHQDSLFLPHVAFEVRQNKYDANYVITSIGFARRLFERDGFVTDLELKLHEGVDVDAAQQRIQSQLGPSYRVLNRYEQQEDSFRIMQVEKLISYIFLTFVLVVACFNIIGSLSMLIIDKREDVRTLRNLGANEKQISRIFMIEGCMISIAGAIVGIAFGLLLCYLQQTYGLISFGNGDENFIINAYPVSVHALDIVLIFFTVAVVSFISVWYPVRHFSKRFTK